MKKQLLLIGSGGHAKSIIDALRMQEEYEIAGILDANRPENTMVGKIPVIGSDDKAEACFKQGMAYAFIAVGSVGNCMVRKKIAGELKKIGFNFPVIIDPSAIIAEGVRIGEGSFVGKGAVINAGAQLGRHCIINTGSIIEHDCSIGDYVHTAPGSVLCGQVEVGNETHIGANSTVVQGIHIGNRCLIGAGSVVIHNIKEQWVAYGNPCKEVKKNG